MSLYEDLGNTEVSVQAAFTFRRHDPLYIKWETWSPFSHSHYVTDLQRVLDGSHATQATSNSVTLCQQKEMRDKNTESRRYLCKSGLKGVRCFNSCFQVFLNCLPFRFQCVLGQVLRSLCICLVLGLKNCGIGSQHYPQNNSRASFLLSYKIDCSFFFFFFQRSAGAVTTTWDKTHFLDNQTSRSDWQMGNSRDSLHFKVNRGEAACCFLCHRHVTSPLHQTNFTN